MAEHEEGSLIGVGIGCALVLGWITFWSVVIYIAVHFVGKYW